MSLWVDETEAVKIRETKVKMTQSLQGENTYNSEH